MLDYPGWRRLLADEPLPALLVDLDAVDRNLALLTAPLEGRPLTLRVASKSIRHPWLLRYLSSQGGARLRGLMTYSPEETTFLADRGFDDLLLAYPLVERAAAEAMADLAARGVRAIAMVDSAPHLAPLSEAAERFGAEIPVCLDIDASLRIASQHLGVRRSPLRGAEAARALAVQIRETPGIHLAGVMAYEAQVAGVRDRDPRKPWMAPAIRWLKGRSIPAVRTRRAEVVAALSEASGGPLALVNGGGTGSGDFESASLGHK